MLNKKPDAHGGFFARTLVASLKSDKTPAGNAWQRFTAP
jgi:hypothetical protein